MWECKLWATFRESSICFIPDKRNSYVSHRTISATLTHASTKRIAVGNCVCTYARTRDQDAWLVIVSYRALIWIAHVLNTKHRFSNFKLEQNKVKLSLFCQPTICNTLRVFCELIILLSIISVWNPSWQYPQRKRMKHIHPLSVLLSSQRSGI